jgi:hypothetical protein
VNPSIFSHLKDKKRELQLHDLKTKNINRKSKLKNLQFSLFSPMTSRLPAKSPIGDSHRNSMQNRIKFFYDHASEGKINAIITIGKNTDLRMDFIHSPKDISQVESRWKFNLIMIGIEL